MSSTSSVIPCHELTGVLGCDDGINPLSPPFAPVQGRLRSPPAKSNFLAVSNPNFGGQLPISIPSLSARSTSLTSSGIGRPLPPRNTGEGSPRSPLFFGSSFWGNSPPCYGHFFGEPVRREGEKAIHDQEFEPVSRRMSGEIRNARRMGGREAGRSNRKKRLDYAVRVSIEC